MATIAERGLAHLKELYAHEQSRLSQEALRKLASKVSLRLHNCRDQRAT